ncbi:MAG: CAP domain-containing protein, partial [Isosphaeraceae bacterium]
RRREQAVAAVLMPRRPRPESTGMPTRRRLIAMVWVLTATGCSWMPAHPVSIRGGDDPGERMPRPATPEELEALRTQIVDAHNAFRTDAKLKRLTINRKLTAAAQAHAEDMASRRKMTHTGGDGSSSAERVKARGYRYFRAGENVAAGRFTAERVMKGWMNSPAHKRNILGGYSEIGVGYAVDDVGTGYWCVTFGLPSSR